MDVGRFPSVSINSYAEPNSGKILYLFSRYFPDCIVFNPIPFTVMDGKSILLKHLPDDPEQQTKIILDTFGRFYRVSTSIFAGDDGLQADRTADLSAKKRMSKDMKVVLYRKYYPLLEVDDLCQDFIQLDIKELEKFRNAWSKHRVKNLTRKRSDSDLDMHQIVSCLNSLHDENRDKLQQDWGKIKEEFVEFKEKLGAKVGSAGFEIKNLVQNLDQIDGKDLSSFEKQLATIKVKLTEQGMGTLFLDLEQKYEQTDSARLDKHKIWMTYSALLLKNLAKDIQLVKSVDADGWDRTILQEVIRLILFINKIFEDPNIFSRLKNVDRKFSEARDSVEKEWAQLDAHLTKDETQDGVNTLIIQDAAQESRNVSAKTIRELYILNHLSRAVLNGRLRIGQLDTLTLKSNIEKELKDICELLREKQLLINQTYSIRDQGAKKGKNRLELAWVPNMIAVVLDLNAGFLLTGGSQPACKDHFLLKAAAKKITHLHVGQEFGPILNDCYSMWKTEKCNEWRSEEFQKRMNEWPENDLESELQDLFAEEKLQVFNQLPTSNEGAKIICWAVCGNTFELRSPCPRCAYLYSSWDLNKTTEFSSRRYLTEYLNGTMANAKEGMEFHCAETVAAASIYAWRHETIGFS